MSAQKSKSYLLSLPTEIRFMIYELLLTQIQPLDVLTIFKRSENSNIHSSILRTCKQVQNEASMMLYSKNKFLFGGSVQDLEWLQRIGRVNIKYLTSIRIYVGDMDYHISPSWGPPTIFLCYKIIGRLTREATGLRHVEVYWEAADMECLVEHIGHTEPGKDPNFVRELAKIKNLQTVILDGTYASFWPQYLTEKMGVLVKDRYAQRTKKV